MIQGLEDVRKLAHGTYHDVIVVEHRRPAPGSDALKVVLELPERSRVVDSAGEFDIDGLVTRIAPAVGESFRLIIGPTAAQASRADALPGSTLRYETIGK